jgi:hypothetical protein
VAKRSKRSFAIETSSDFEKRADGFESEYGYIYGSSGKRELPARDLALV